MRYLFLIIVFYFVFKAARNLLHAAQQNQTPRQQVKEKKKHADLDVEEAKWEDIE